MKGKIRIINTKTGIGRIILDDARESGIITFPPTFEEGDNADVRFQHDDPSQRILSLTALSDEWHYGFIIIPPDKEKKFGKILVTYPQVKGLLFFHVSKLHQSQGHNNLHRMKVRFKIKKMLDGKQQAIVISDNVEKNEQYKCSQPQFGKLEVTQEQTHTGIVQSVITTKEQTTSTGTIKFINDSNKPIYGFIKQDENLPDVFFNARAYQQFYNNPPKKDAKVSFESSKTPKGINVKKFCHPSEPQSLSIDAQYGIFEPVSKPGEEIYFPSRYFNSIYGREPEAGDLVFFHRPANDRVVFYLDESQVVQHIRIRGIENRQNKIPPSKSSTVLNGFIEQSEPHTSKSKFSGFSEIDPSVIYYVYKDGEGLFAEIRQFNPKMLSESISCYKDADLLNQHKLQAIEALIQFEYEDKHIKQDKLKQKRIDILHQLVEDNIGQGNIANALEYEARVQQLDYSPKRLHHFSGLTSEYIFDSLEKEINIINDSKSEPWHITITQNIDEISDLPPPVPYLLMHDAADGVAKVPKDDSWAFVLDGLNEQPQVVDYELSVDNEYALIFDTQYIEN